MTQDERIAYFTALCEQLYNPKSPSERDHTQKLLEFSFPTFADDVGNGIAVHPPGLDNAHSFAITSPTDTASALRVMLENSPNPFVHTFCLSRLSQLIQAQFSLFADDTKIRLRTFVLEYSFMHPDLAPFVIAKLASVLALLTRLGWQESEEYQNVQKDLAQFLQASIQHRIVGMQMLAVLIQDFNAPSSPGNSAKFRKAASGFRDTQLLPIFETALETIKELLQHSIPFETPDQGRRMKDATVNVFLKCLSFDFAGISVDESSEDIGTVQLPISWRPIFEDETFVPTLFSAYREFGSPHSAKVMESLVLVASVRKALFTGDEERSAFVVSIMQGIRDVILTSQGMNDTENYNEFCRLLYRFRATAPLNEMADKPDYANWIGMIADFTLQAFQSWKWAPNTALYLLGFWARITQSMSYYQQLGEVNVRKLESITTELTKAYISTNVDSVAARIEEGLDDPLENEDTLTESLGLLGTIARCKYKESCDIITSVFDPIALQYQELVAQAASGVVNGDALKEALDVIETKFSWLVYVMGVLVGSRPTYLSSDELDIIDGELTIKVLQLMDVYQMQQNQHGSSLLNQKLDLSFVYFFTQFRKAYISESSSKVYVKMSEIYGISDQVAMLNIIMRKIISNFQYWGNDELVIRRTLELFNELASGYSAVKNLRKIETTQLILQNHMPPEFAFFQNQKNNRNRMLYYEVLCKILFAEDIGEREFYAFMKPFDLCLEPLETLDTIEGFRQDAVRRLLQDVFRDLRGFIRPIQSRRYFMFFFDWFYPKYMPILLRALEAWSPDPSVIPLLKFFADFVHNKSHRLNFPVSSPNSILLFRDASRVITTYGRHILEQPVISQREKYPYKYKGISICFNILSLCLSGQHINFGVFWLYQDKAIDEAFHMMFQLIVNIPLDDMMDFPKLTRAFITLLREFTFEQLMALPTLLPDTFLYLMRACELGVGSSDTLVRSHACAAINNVCTFVARETNMVEMMSGSAQPLDDDKVTGSPPSHRRSSASTHWLVSYLRQFPDILPTLLYTVYSLILFDDQDQWALSRPLYVLMLLQKERAIEYTNDVISVQLPERREFVAKALNKLMDGIGWTLTEKDRERFSQNTTAFKRELAGCNVVLVPLKMV